MPNGESESFLLKSVRKQNYFSSLVQGFAQKSVIAITPENKIQTNSEEKTKSIPIAGDKIRFLEGFSKPENS